MGTPCGSSNLGEIDGHCAAGAVKREFGCAAFSLDPLCHGRPRQSVRRSGTGPSIPSHQGEPSSVTATLVKIEFLRRVAMALGFVFGDVPGATAKKPASGLLAQRPPSGSRSVARIS